MKIDLKKLFFKRSKIIALAVAVFFFVLPFLDRSVYHIDVMVSAGIFMILALGLNVIVGYAGILNLGFAALFASGAYIYGICNLHFHTPFWVGLFLSGFGTALFGMLLAFPALRLSGDYLAIVTLGAGEIVRIILNNADQITGGPNGLLGIDHPVIGALRFGVKSTPYYYLVFALILLLVFFLRRLECSRIGRAWTAMREDELAASSMGVNLMWAKLTAFGIGGFIGGLAGCVFAAKQGSISPDSFDFVVSVMVLAMIVLGGLGNIKGALAGALILSLLPEFFRGFDRYRMLFFGIAMIMIMLFRPQGLFGEVRYQAKYLSKKKKSNEA